MPSCCSTMDMALSVAASGEAILLSTCHRPGLMLAACEAARLRAWHVTDAWLVEHLRVVLARCAYQPHLLLVIQAVALTSTG